MKPGIDDLIAVGDYQRAYNWELRFTQIPNVLRGYVTSDQLNVRCTSLSTPKTTNKPITVDVRGVEIRIPGIQKYSESIKLNLNETTDAYTRKIIEIWREACWSYKNGKGTDYSDIVGVLRADLLKGDHERVSTASFYLYHVWMTDFAFPDLGSKNEVYSPTITLSYNYYAPTTTV